MDGAMNTMHYNSKWIEINMLVEHQASQYKQF